MKLIPLKVLVAGIALATLSAPAIGAPILLDINSAGSPTAFATDFINLGVTNLAGSEAVGGLSIGSTDDSRTSFVFSTGQTMTFSVRAQGGWDKNVGNEVLDDYIYLEKPAKGPPTGGNSGPIQVSLGNLGLSPSTTYTLYLFGNEGTATQLSAFTPGNNTGITFASTATSNGDLVVNFTTSAAYASEPISFTWARVGSNTFAVFNGIAIVPTTPGGGGGGGSGGPELQWISSTDGNYFVQKPNVPLGATVPVSDSTAARIIVNSTQTYQQIEGWGGCFNERGWKAMEGLTTSARNAVMNSLFNSSTGLKLNYCRTPIGASDYAIDLYSLDEVPGDYNMTNFSISRDQQRLIPYIKAAQAIRPDLKFWASPWSPPSWMKNNNSLSGPGSDNSIKDDPQTLAALALYFARYVEAYAGQGINISMVMPQNEPNMTTNYTSCLWTGSQLARFVGYHLGPTLAARGLTTKIYLGTLNESSYGGYSYWVEPSMKDPTVRPYITGLGCQWDADVDMIETNVLHPALPLMQTEAECGNHENNWWFAEYQFQLALKWFNAGASSNIIWNLVLDQTGLSTGGWAQNSPIVVDSNTGQVTYTPYYYLYKHFSGFIEPGAYMVTAYSSFWGDKLAFVNPDGSVVVIVGNSAATPFSITLNINGDRTNPISIPAHSFNTFILPAPTP